MLSSSLLVMAHLGVMASLPFHSSWASSAFSLIFIGYLLVFIFFCGVRGGRERGGAFRKKRPHTPAKPFAKWDLHSRNVGAMFAPHSAACVLGKFWSSFFKSLRGRGARSLAYGISLLLAFLSQYYFHLYSFQIHRGKRR